MKAPAAGVHRSLESQENQENHLLDGLVAYWPGDEESGDLLDAHENELDCTDYNTVTYDTGHVYDTARHYEDANQEYHLRSSESLLRLGDHDWTVAAWVTVESYPAATIFAGIASKDGYYKREWTLVFWGGPNEFQFNVYNGQQTKVGSVTWDEAAELDTWYLVIAEHDSLNNTVSIQIDDAEPIVEDTSGALGTNSAALKIGVYYDDWAASRFWDGLIGPVMIWKSAAGGDRSGILSDARRAALWNNGNGLTYEDFTE